MSRVSSNYTHSVHIVYIYIYYVLVVIILLLLLLSSSGSRAYDDISNFISTYLPIAKQKVFRVHAILIHTIHRRRITIIMYNIYMQQYIIVYTPDALLKMLCEYIRIYIML